MTMLPSDRPLEVLVVTHYYAAHGGGIEQVAASLIRNVSSSANIHFTWAASDTDALPDLRGQAILPMRAVNWLEYLFGVPWPVWGPGSLRRLKRAVESADIVWIHDTLYMGNLLAFRWAQALLKPIVITQHIGPIAYRNPLLRKLMAWADKTLTVPMLKAATRTLFVSDRVAEDYYRRAGFTAPVTIVPNSVNLRLFNLPLLEKRRYLRHQFALRAEQPVVLFVGRFVTRKGLAVLRHLAMLLPQWRFWLAGRGPIDPARWMLPNVHVFKDRSGASLAELYQAADIFVLPSYGEGFPLVIQEALACGLPVVCSHETAAGCRASIPLLCEASVWPNDAKRTANVWAEKLKTFPLPLPLEGPLAAHSEFAQASWEWPAIADAYADIFRSVFVQQGR